MRNTIGNLWLGLALILAASAGLLLSDLGHRATATHDVPRIAFFYFVDRPATVDCLNGAYEGLEREGFVKGKDYQAQVFDAQADMPTANTIAKAIVDGGFDMVITLTTPALQAMAGANQQGRVMHVFGCVTDPAGSGVGISPNDPLDHPAHLAGVGTFQPVEHSFELARAMRPELKKVGTVWTSSETCAEACVRKAHAKCDELGIELLEAQIDNANGILEAAKALAAKDVEAFWVGGDNTVEMAIGTLTGVAKDAGVPVFCNTPTHAEAGALFGLGANYYDVGVVVGEMAGRIRKGLDPTTIRIENVVPEDLNINLATLKALKARWQISDQLRAKASVVIDKSGKKPGPNQQSRAPTAGDAGWRLAIIYYTDNPVAESTVEGFLEQLNTRGLAGNRDYTAEIRSANGETTTLLAIVDETISNRPDLIVALSTPVLQAVTQKVADIPIVFSMVTDGVAAGAGESNERHRPNITGITTFSDFEGTAKLVRECMPAARTVGTLYTPSEINSVIFRDALAEAVMARGMRLESVAATTTSEVADAMAALLSKHVDAVCQISDNLANAAFPAVSEAATRRRVPVFAFGTSFIAEQGAVMGVCRDYEQAGRDAAELAIRIRDGESPGDIPFAPVSRTLLVVNARNAAAIGWTVPPAVLARADKVVS